MNDRATVLLPGELVAFHDSDDKGSPWSGHPQLYSWAWPRDLSCERPRLVASVNRTALAVVIAGPSEESTAGPMQQHDQYLWYLIVSEGRLGWACRNVIMQL